MERARSIKGDNHSKEVALFLGQEYKVALLTVAIFPLLPSGTVKSLKNCTALRIQQDWTSVMKNREGGLGTGTN